MKIVQIGANDGQDKVYQLINGNRSSIELAVLVEPIPFIIQQLKNTYSGIDNVIVENIAIADTDTTTLDIYYVEDSNYELSSFSRNHILDHGCPVDKIKCLSIPAMTINNLLDKYGIVELEYLFIDTEGLDTHIISTIDFAKYRIQNLIFEHAHADGANKRGNNFLEITRYLSELGYTLTFIDNLNIKASL